MEHELRIETDRLVLTPLTMRDVPDLFEIFKSKDAMRFMSSPPHSQITETESEVTDMLTPESGWLAIRLKDQPRVIGYVGFLGNQGVPGMGYILDPRHWRNGYMAEAARAALEYGFTGMGFDRVELWIQKENIASQKLAAKIGFTRRGRFCMKYPHQMSAHEKVVYGLYRDEWLSDQSSPRRMACYGMQPVMQVPDVRSTAAFYSERLGFDIEFLYGDPPTHGGVCWCDWTTEGAHIQLSQETITGAPHPGLTLYFFVGSDIDELYHRYIDTGIPIVQEIATQPWHMREFVIHDCNGYVLRFGTPA